MAKPPFPWPLQCRVSAHIQFCSQQKPNYHKRKQASALRLLVFVEGIHDIEFLKRISLVAQSCDSQLPDLSHLERTRQIIFIPTGGNARGWMSRLAPLQIPEFHLLDGETSPTTQLRQRIATEINQRARCRAFVTQHRALENYLHPAAIESVSGLTVIFTDTEDVPAIVAQGMYGALLPTTAWPDLSRRARKRYCERAKRWLNTDAVSAMTPALLKERDPQGEVVGWLKAIAQLSEND